MSKTKQLLRSLLPPLIIDLFKGINRRQIWSGNYASWSDATKDSTGYDTSEILQKVTLATEMVCTGKAVFERDSVLFQKQIDHSDILTALLYCHTKSNNQLSVFDFGGSLGSTYFQFKSIFQKIPINLSWTVVEQPHFVQVGNSRFKDTVLEFSIHLEEAFEKHKKNCRILIMSASLQYFENPYDVISKIIEQYDFDYIVMARIPLHMENGSKLTVQTVPPSIYKASYPCWFFNETEFLAVFKQKYDLVLELNTPDTCLDFPSQFKGFFFEKHLNLD